MRRLLSTARVVVGQLSRKRSAIYSMSGRDPAILSVDDAELQFKELDRKLLADKDLPEKDEELLDFIEKSRSR